MVVLRPVPQTLLLAHVFHGDQVAIYFPASVLKYKTNIMRYSYGISLHIPVNFYFHDSCIPGSFAFIHLESIYVSNNSKP